MKTLLLIIALALALPASNSLAAGAWPGFPSVSQDDTRLQGQTIPTVNQTGVLKNTQTLVRDQDKLSGVDSSRSGNEHELEGRSPL